MEENLFFFSGGVGLGRSDSASVDGSCDNDSPFLSRLGDSWTVADAKTRRRSMVNPTILMTQPKPRFGLFKRASSMIGQTTPPMDAPPITIPMARPL